MRYLSLPRRQSVAGVAGTEKQTASVFGPQNIGSICRLEQSSTPYSIPPQACPGLRSVGPIPRDCGTYQTCVYLILTVLLAGTPGHPPHQRVPHFSINHPSCGGSSCR